MPRRAKTLTDREVRGLRTSGLHSVGGLVPGLALQVTQTPGKDPARSWVFRAMVDGRRRAMGLGAYPAVSLADARRKAEAIWHELQGRRPLLPTRPSDQTPHAEAGVASLSFKAATVQYIEERRSSWKNQKHAAQWEATLQTYAYPVMGRVPVADVDRAMVLRVIKPIWHEKTETAKRVRDRIKLVLSWAKAHGMREGDNPADWRGNLEHALPAPEKVRRVRHQPALPVAAVSGFMRRLQSEQSDVAAKALAFLILTAARDGEVRGATWDEVDLKAAVWTVPAERMKAGKPHRVPLSKAALSILKALPRTADMSVVFPGQSSGGRLSETTLNEVIKRLHARQAVPSDAEGRPAVMHGMRSTFRNGGRTLTKFRPELLELSLAHTGGSAVERAYAREDALDQRRDVMNAWADFVGPPVRPE